MSFSLHQQAQRVFSRRRLGPRWNRIFAWVIVLGGLLSLYVLLQTPSAFPPLTVDPLALELNQPTFDEARNYERRLPQHTTPSRYWGSSTKPRYLFFRDVQTGSGWNNVFEEQIMNSHLAYLSDRAYVFPAFTPRDHPPFPDILPNGERHPIYIPMNALVSGPTGGGPLSADGSDPIVRRSISEEWWNIACPKNDVFVVELNPTLAELGVDDSSEGDVVLAKWGKKLRDIDATCVAIHGGSVISWMWLTTFRPLSAWPMYGSSPILRDFAWSPLVTAALFHNFHLLSEDAPPKYLTPTKKSPPYPFDAFRPLRTAQPPIAGLLAMHVRRGDYEGHCPFLGEVSAEFNAWNNLGMPGASHPYYQNKNPPHNASYEWPKIPDYFNIPEGMTRKEATVMHCWPSVEAIVKKAREVREGAQAGTWDAPRHTLRTVYVSTNGDRAWLNQLAAALKADGWSKVSSSLDMDLTREAQAVSQAVDQGILAAAESFIGVGFSSLSSNSVQIRLGGGRAPGTIHFW